MSAIDSGRLQSSLTNGSIAETVESLVEIVKEQAERIDELESRLDDQADRQARETANNRKRISAIEQSTTDKAEDSPHSQDGGEGSPQAETPLEQVCELDETTAEQQLTPNQKRARFIAQNPADYFSKVPAGYTIDSGEIGKVLRAGTDCDGHTATVSRVMGFLDDFGESEVKVVKRRGTKRVVFTAELVDRLSRRCDRTQTGVV
jgi:hypothetical protein